MGARIAVRTACIAGLLQAVMWLLVGCMEFVGLERLQRNVLEMLLSLYLPALAFFETLTPKAWQAQGNILLGFMAVAFGVAVYSLVLGVAGEAIRLALGAKRGKS